MVLLVYRNWFDGDLLIFDPFLNVNFDAGVCSKGQPNRLPGFPHLDWYEVGIDEETMVCGNLAHLDHFTIWLYRLFWVHSGKLFLDQTEAEQLLDLREKIRFLQNIRRKMRLWMIVEELQRIERMVSESSQEGVIPSRTAQSPAHRVSRRKTDRAELIKSTHHQSGRSDFIIKGFLNKTRVTAFPDTGSDCNIISRATARRCGLIIKREARKKIRLPNGNSWRTIGTVKAKFSFQNGIETGDCLQTFHVVPRCVYDLMLGNDFLRETETLTRHFDERVEKIERSLSKTRRLFLVGDVRDRLAGSIEGVSTNALPDTGADINVISASFAKKQGFLIDESRRTAVEFADGSVQWTIGIVHDLKWKFGGQISPDRESFYGLANDDRICSFHVLDSLSMDEGVDVVLSRDFVLEHNVFEDHKEHLHFVGLQDEALDRLFLIRELFPGKVPTVLPDRIREGILAEMDRRDDVDDRILRLPEPERSSAWEAEGKVRRDWVRTNQRLAASLMGSAQGCPSGDDTGTQSSSTPTATSCPQEPSHISSKSRMPRLTKYLFWRKKSGSGSLTGQV